MRRPVPILMLGYTLLAVAWAVGNAPFGAPDEEAHYTRALGVSEGRLVGPRAPLTIRVASPRQARWAADQARAERIPAGLSSVGYACTGPFTDRTAACQDGLRPDPATSTEVSTAGDFQPLPYLLPALVMPLASRPPGALRLGRLASLLPCLILLAIGLAALADADGLALVGPVIALTPQVIFLSASLTGSGPEILASFAFAASLIGLARHGPRALRARWAGAGIAGVVLALSRTLGPGWVILDLVGVTLVCGPGGLWSSARGARPIAAAAGLAVLAAVVGNRAWEGAHGVHVSADPLPSSAALGTVLHGLGDVWWGAIARFGSLEVRPPQPVPALWALAVLALVALAVRGAGPRQGGRLALLAALVGGGTLWFAALVVQRSGFTIQGRDVLAALILPVLLAGELAHRHRERLSPRLRVVAPTVVLTAAGLVQLGCFLVDGHRFAVGSDGPVFFATQAAWSPPAGWWPWIVLAAAGGASLVVAGVRARGAAAAARGAGALRGA